MAERQYTVTVKPKILRGVEKLPLHVREAFVALARDLGDKGPIQPRWRNFSALSDPGTYHCHLKYRYVACWRLHGQNEIEIYYAGSREGAPY